MINDSYLMPVYKRLAINFEEGAGCWLLDNNGDNYLDAISGIGVTNLGHAHPIISKTISKQAQKLIHTSNLFEIKTQERLGKKLCELSGMQSAFFCNSGAEANEAAIKLARLHAKKRGIESPKIIVMENAFHGRTLAALSATDNFQAQSGFEPLFPGFIRMPINDINPLIKIAQQESDIVAVLIEPIQGEGGVRVVQKEYMQQLRKLCDQHQWLLMLDEIQTGLGRTGSWFAFEQLKIQPDVITLAKALGNGLPIGACLVTGKASKYFGVGKHGSTFGGNPLACQTALSVLQIIETENLVLRARETGCMILNRLKSVFTHEPGIKEFRGQGMMIGIEFFRDCQSLVKYGLKYEKILLNVSRTNTLRLLPPLIMTDDEIKELITRVIRTIQYFLDEK